MKTHTTSEEIQQFLDRQFLSKTKLYNMAIRHGFWKSQQHLKSGPFIALGDDGKRSNVRQKHGQMINQDKIVIIDQVTLKYVDFFFVKKEEGSALHHTNHFLNILEKYNSVKSLLSLNLDGCSGNTGVNGGFLRRLECALGMFFDYNLKFTSEKNHQNHYFA